MGNNCTTCGVAVAGTDIMYASDGRIVCTACFGNLAPGGPPNRAPWRTFGIAGGITALIPFGIHVATSSSTSVNGHVTSFVYRDWFAVACGVVAIAVGLVALGAARKEQLQRALAFAAGIAVVVLGGVQIARGFGVFEKPGDQAGTSMSMTFENSTTQIAGPDMR